MDDANTNRIFDYEDIGWAENRSKRLHDPLLMANVKDGKKKKDRASSLKPRFLKPQKKGRKFVPAISQPSLPEVCSNLGTSPADRIRLNPDMYDKADKLLYSSLNEWGLLLAASDNLNHVWAQTLVDPFLRRLILREVATVRQLFLQYSS